MTTQQIVLQGPGPWGFRLVGGKDFEQPLAISRVIRDKPITSEEERFQLCVMVMAENFSAGSQTACETCDP